MVAVGVAMLEYLTIALAKKRKTEAGSEFREIITYLTLGIDQIHHTDMRDHH